MDKVSLPFDVTNRRSQPCDGEIDIMEQWGGDGPTNQTTGGPFGKLSYSSSNHFYKAFQHS